MRTYIIYSILLFLFLNACNALDEPFDIDSKIDLATIEEHSFTDFTDYEVVTETDVRKVAEKMANSKLMGRKSIKNAQNFTISIINNKRGVANIYVVNYVNNGGFILISGTKNYVPILAYSSIGNYNTDGEKPGGVKIWEDETAEALKMSKSFPLDTIRKYRKMWYYYESPDYHDNYLMEHNQRNILDFDLETAWANQLLAWYTAGYEVYPITQAEITGNSVVDNRFRYSAQQSIYPLYEDEWEHYSAVVKRYVSNISHKSNFIYTLWDQKNGYNDSCPILPNGNHAAVGCGPLAVAQVMRYYQYPSSFNWSYMPYYYPTSITAQFLHTVGVKCNADYDSITGIYLEDARDALLYYGYSASIANHNFSRTISNLQQNRPVIMRGQLTKSDNKTAGHEWIASGFNNSFFYDIYEVYTFNNRTTIDVVDTYDTNFIFSDYIYMIWGWGGSYDGYYHDNSLSIPSYVTSVSNRRNIYDIYPNY